MVAYSWWIGIHSNKHIIYGTNSIESPAPFRTRYSSASSRCCGRERAHPGVRVHGTASVSFLRVTAHTLLHSSRPPPSSEAARGQRTRPATSDSDSTAPSSGRRATRTLDSSTRHNPTIIVHSTLRRVHSLSQHVSTVRPNAPAVAVLRSHADAERRLQRVGADPT